MDFKDIIRYQAIFYKTVWLCRSRMSITPGFNRGTVIRIFNAALKELNTCYLAPSGLIVMRWLIPPVKTGGYSYSATYVAFKIIAPLQGEGGRYQRKSVGWGACTNGNRWDGRQKAEVFLTTNAFLTTEASAKEVAQMVAETKHLAPD